MPKKASSQGHKKDAVRRPPTYGKNPSAALVRGQAALRQQRFRSRKREDRDERRAADQAAVDNRGLQLGGKKYRNFTVYENVDWVIRVGSTPSAAGARAPLAGIVSNVTCSATNRWSVELYRWRVYVYLAQLESERVLQIYRDGCYGLRLNFDETPTRMYCNAERRVVSGSTQVRLVSLYGHEGLQYRMYPTLARPRSGGWMDLFAALDFPSLQLDEFAGRTAGWRFVLFVPDGARSNRSIARAFVTHVASFPRAIVLHAECFAHVLSNSTKWALASDFPYGSFVRLSHILQARPLTRIAEIRSARLAPPVVAHPPEEVALGRTIWEFILERMIASNGPFVDARSKSLASERVTQLHKLWPLGLPNFDDPWPQGARCTVSEYDDAIRFLFRRTITTPVASRWYSVEQFAWFLIAARSFRVIENVVGRGDTIAYWPCDNPVDQVMEPSRYACQSRDRLARALDFSESFLCTESIFAAAVSSIPRWVFARCLFSGPSGDPAAPGSVARACSLFLETANEICRGRHDVVEALLSRETENGRLRLRCLAAIGRTALYLSERNMPYTGAFWRIIRGELPVEDIVDTLEPACCSESGTTVKIRQALESLTEYGRVVALTTLCDMLRSCVLAYGEKNGAVNLESESAFSQLRALGLKLPYRPMTLTTAQREMTIRYVRDWHKQWFHLHVASVYGNLRNMRALRAQQPVKVNGFSAFCRALCVQFSEGRKLWAELDAEQKGTWGDIAAKINSTQNEITRKRLADMEAAPQVGPLGSCHRSQPISTQDVFSRLNSENDSLAATWSKRAIAKYKAKLAAPPAPYTPRPEAVSAFSSVLLAGEKCGRCKADRAKAVASLSGVCDAVCAAFMTEEEPRCGCVMAFAFGEDIIYFDLLLLFKSPRRLLALPFDVLQWSDVAEPGIGLLPFCGAPRFVDVFDGRSCCLVSLFLDRGRPSAAWHFKKAFAESTVDSGWACYLVDGVTKLALPAVGAISRARRHPKAPAPADDGLFGLRAYAEMFGDSPAAVAEVSLRAGQPQDLQGEVESGDDEYILPAAGSSEQDGIFAQSLAQADLVSDAFSPDLKIGEDEQLLFTQRVREVIDLQRYSVCVRIWEGNIVVFWKDSEKTRFWAQYVDACRKTKQLAGCRELTSSKSSTMSKHTLAGALERAKCWQQWHAAWVYGVRPTCDMLPGFSLPTTRLVATHVAEIASLSSSSCASVGDESEDDLLQSEAQSSSDIASTSLGSDYSSPEQRA